MVDPSGARSAPPIPAPPTSAGRPPPVPANRSPLRATRTGNTWIGIVIFGLVLVLLLIFLLQNTQSVKISYLGMSGHLSLAVAMLMAAVAGVLLTATAGSLRIWQLRRRVRRSTRR
ncbi:lipopolysaccharide assembly protein LapA domain-containing protein [Nocardia sp. NPDC051570]|uniref:lipopolysaccharide assembly protein LapA domain-containing protein n=1 Tax=Nocardia sp. NPDC051570 TaxID=3364324 RepID=UPI0037903FA9